MRNFSSFRYCWRRCSESLQAPLGRVWCLPSRSILRRPQARLLIRVSAMSLPVPAPLRGEAARGSTRPRRPAPQPTSAIWSIALLRQPSSVRFADHRLALSIFTGTYCTGAVTPSAKCAAATGAVCNISKVYDQTGSARDWTATTAATQATLVFAAINSLPALACSGTVNMITPTITQSVPYTGNVVFNRTTGTAAGTALGSGNGFLIGYTNVANAGRASGGGVVGFTIADTVYHGVSAVINGASGANNVDGVETPPRYGFKRI